jgi:type IV pilus assembly protein PilB
MRDKFAQRVRKALAKHGALELSRLDEAYGIAEREDAISFSEVLFERGFVDEMSYLSAISLETNFPPIDLDKVAPDTAALTVINQDLASYYCVLPVSKAGNILTLAVGQPFDILKLDDLRLLTNSELRPLVGTERSIRRNLSRAYTTDEWDGMPGTGEEPAEQSNMAAAMAAAMQGGDAPADGGLEVPEKPTDEVVDIAQAVEEAQGSPVIKVMNTLIVQALRDKGSDIHIEAYEKQSIVRFRVDGVLKDMATPPKTMHNAIISRIKVMSQLDVAERRIPQDGKFQVRFEGRQVDFRVSILPCIHGEKAVVRILDSSSLNLGISQLGYEPEAEAAFRRSLEASYGMILLTGPTGSGKSTTLYASLREVLNPEENVVTIEDPVEYQLDGVVQTPVNVKAGLTFATALRSTLRQDPDIIMVGEIRDFETADIAVKAAITGHLVLSTLHTNDAASAITRLTDMGVDAFMVSSSAVLVAAQRLCRRLCDSCKAPLDAFPSKEDQQRMGFVKGDDLKGLRKPVGCANCSAGYRGRFAIIEALEVDDNIRRMIIQERPPAEIKAYAMTKGMLTLRRTGLLNALRGKTSLEEVVRMTMGD